MRRRRLDGGVRGLVRAADAKAAKDRPSRSGEPPFEAPMVDLLARALVLPMSRRRTVGLVAGALLAGSAWRPKLAHAACGGDTPKECAQGGGAVVCVPSDYVCCSTDKCAQACRGWQACTGKSCSDTSKICGYPGGPYPNPYISKYCSISSTASNFCTNYQPQEIRLGWCCRVGEICGSQLNDCTCPGVQCGETLCCARGEVCDSNIFGTRNACVKKCDDGTAPCRGTCCEGDLICTSDGCACPSGSVQRGLRKCVPPKEDPGDPRWNPFRNLLNMMGAASAAHGGGGSGSMVGHAAQSGSPAIDSALVALAAVDGQAAAAALAFGEGKPDRAFRRRVRVARVKPPRVVAGTGLDAASATALNKLVAAEARAYALAAASAKALWRARAAKAKGQRALAKRQLRASSKFAGQAASALKRVPALRRAAAAALTAGGVTEVIATEDQVKAFLANVKSGSIPAELRTALARLGVGSKDLKRLRAGLLKQTVSSGSGPALLEPLKERAGASELKRVTSQLSQYSKRARRHPIAR